MRDFTTKVDDNGTTQSGQLGAAEFNEFIGELENAISDSGLTLTTATTEQLSTAIMIAAGKANSLVSSGTANAVELVPQDGLTGWLMPANYTALDGWRVRFTMPFQNTGAVTVAIGQTVGTLLAAKKLFNGADGVEFASGELPTGTPLVAVYDAAADSAAGAFIVEDWIRQPLLPRGYLGGLQTSNNGVDADHDIDISAGECRSEGGVAENIVVTATQTIAIDNAGDRVDSSTLDADDTYHILVGRDTAGALVAGFSKALSLPSGWRSWRRVASVLTDASANIRGYVQRGDAFALDAPIGESLLSLTTDTASLKAFTVPSDIRTRPLLALALDPASTTSTGLAISSPDSADWLPGSTAASAHTVLTDEAQFADIMLEGFHTDTASQLRCRRSTSGTTLDLYFTTHGWVDTRGRDS